ncbi:MAG TPA: hypothetical protein VM536_15200 [Chloroflexia bacterium]|nr:hypothetical protein [Chloroflexia bacterium]
MTDYRRPSPNSDSLAEQLRAERQRAARLAAELVLERDKVRQLEEGFNRKDSEAWHQHATIETLKVELRSIAAMAAQLQDHILASGGDPTPPVALPSGAPAGPPLTTATPLNMLTEDASPAAQEAQMGLKLALMDLEDRLQQAVGLVLDELNTRKAAEARIQELEQQLAAVRRRIAPPA